MKHPTKEKEPQGQQLQNLNLREEQQIVRWTEEQECRKDIWLPAEADSEIKQRDPKAGLTDDGDALGRPCLPPVLLLTLLFPGLSLSTFNFSEP